MAMKKTIGAIVASFILLSVGGYLIHSVWLAQDYVQHSDLWRTQDAMMHRLWSIYIANLIFSIGAVLIYVRGVEAKPWAGQGIRFGILLVLVTEFPNPSSNTLSIHSRTSLCSNGLSLEACSPSS
jgi:hypothetical protein